MSWLRRALPIIGLGAVLAFAAWIWVSPRRSNAGAIARCREAYGAAHTSADSARVDWLIPLPQSKGQMAPLSCRALRDAKLL